MNDPKKCPVCGKEFLFNENGIRTRFCSKKCRLAARRERSKQLNQHYYARKKLARAAADAPAVIAPHDCRISWRRGYDERMGEVVIETRY